MPARYFRRSERRRCEPQGASRGFGMFRQQGPTPTHPAQHQLHPPAPREGRNRGTRFRGGLCQHATFGGAKGDVVSRRALAAGLGCFANKARRLQIQPSTNFTLPLRGRVGIEERDSGEGSSKTRALPSLRLDPPGGRVNRQADSTQHHLHPAERYFRRSERRLSEPQGASRGFGLFRQQGPLPTNPAQHQLHPPAPREGRNRGTRFRGGLCQHATFGGANGDFGERVLGRIVYQRCSGRSKISRSKIA